MAKDQTTKQNLMDMMELFYYIYMDEQEKKKASSSDQEEEDKAKAGNCFPCFSLFLVCKSVWRSHIKIINIVAIICFFNSCVEFCSIIRTI